MTNPATLPAPIPTSEPLPKAPSTGDSRVVRRAAVIAGAAITLVAGLAGFGNLVVVQGLVTSGNAAATAHDILGSQAMFRLGVASLYLAGVLDVVVAWALLRVFSSVNAELARLNAWLRLSYAAVFMVALSQLAGIPSLLTNADGRGAFTNGQLAAEAMAKVDTFHDIWFAALILFGAHLVLAGYLAYKSGFVPRLIGALLVLAGAGYAFDSFAAVMTKHAPFAVSNVTFLGEFLLGLWLLFRGRRISLPTTASG
ncbi:MAG: hypothetical protein QOI06_2536 [Nocardioidaceae bacterium]|jgi:hypothetical protein|nr:hypothetical protein [Nocardioidaceae bacterium]